MERMKVTDRRRDGTKMGKGDKREWKSFKMRHG